MYSDEIRLDKVSWSFQRDALPSFQSVRSEKVYAYHLVFKYWKLNVSRVC